MFENMDWNLLLIALGVIFSGCLVIVEVYQAYNKYVVPKKEKKRLSEKRKLEEKLSSYQDSFGNLERSLKNFVMKNKFERGFGAYTKGLSSDFEERIEKYNEIFDRCVDWKKACKDVITIHLHELSRKHLPKTCKEYDLVSLLNVDNLTQRYLNGEEVTKRWIEKEYPTGLYEVLMENLKDKETKLDLFFLNLNETFEKNEVLERFKNEKKTLIELGHAILKDLKEEEKKLRKELEKYKDIEEKEKVIPEFDL